MNPKLKQAEIAQKALCDWLAAREEMGGKPPKKIEYVFALQDEMNDNRIFFVFRFKKSALGKWLIGVSGGFPDEQSLDCDEIFSGFDEFPSDKNEAADLAFKMCDFIIQFNAREKMRGVFDEKFKLNLNYVSQTEADVDKIARQFVKTNSRFYLTVGTVDVPSGMVIVADPLCYLFGEHVIAPVLDKQIPSGSYPAEVSIYRDEMIGVRMCTARLKIKDTAAVRYELAKPVPGTAAAHLKDGDMSGFPVDAGLMCFIDADGAKDYAEFLGKWHKENPGKNHYDDYFAAFFAESDKKLPAYQREGGDFIEWANPDTGKRMVQISSGLGDGFYQCFWGYNEGGEVCELIVPMVDPDIFEN